MVKDTENRQAYIDKLRKIADFYDKHPEVMIPFNWKEKEYVFCSWQELEVIAKIVGIDLTNEAEVMIIVDNALVFSAKHDTVAMPKRIEVKS